MADSASQSDEPAGGGMAFIAEADSEKRSNENGRERPGSRKERHLPGVVVKK